MSFFDYYWGVLFFILGTVLGSFFNVLIYRMPLEISVIKPPSTCPQCGHQIKWYENIPVLSWLLLLKGRCSSCGNAISARYPTVELLTGIFSLLLYIFYFHGIIFTPQRPALDAIPFTLEYISLMLFVPIAFIDIEHYIIPNEFTMGGTVLALLSSFVPGGITPLESLMGLLVGAGILIIFGKVGQLILKREDTMGWGDIKMLAWFGALWGAPIALGTIFIGAFVGLFGSIVMMFLKKMKRGQHLPFGPYLCTGTFLSLLWGIEILTGYCSLFGIDPTIFVK